VESCGPRAVAKLKALSPVTEHDVVVGATDWHGYETLVRCQQFAKERRAKLLCIHVHGRHAFIGPACSPRTPACIQCWHDRYYTGYDDERAFVDTRIDATASPFITPLSAATIAELAVSLVLTAPETQCGGAAPSVYAWDMVAATGRSMALLPVPGCPLCGEVPPDSPERARITLVPRQKKSADADHLRSLADLKFVAESACVGRTGIVRHIRSSPFTIGAMGTAEVWLENKNRMEVCCGFGDNYEDARTAAILEALERYSGVLPRGRSSFVRGAASSLREHAVNPRLLGLHSAEQYLQHSERLQPYSDDLELDWVWAFSLLHQRAVLVPMELAFYSPSREKAIAFDGSNGCSVGSCPEEAIFHGLLEVVERDALLLSWYTGTFEQRIDLDFSNDLELNARLRMLAAAGFECRAFDVTTDFGIPAVLAVALRSDGAMPTIACAGAAHVQPRRAMARSFRELCGRIEQIRIDLSSANIRERVRLLGADASLVDSISDHAWRYCGAEMQSCFHFLLERDRRITLGELERRVGNSASIDLTHELVSSLQKIFAAGSDVIVVDQTPAELGSLGLWTYKVLVTRALPITFGANLHRLEAMDRLQARLATPASAYDWTMRPHPFA
jgi:ribosomal protein S12 methylthiotransferase accessory factor